MTQPGARALIRKRDPMPVTPDGPMLDYYKSSVCGCYISLGGWKSLSPIGMRVPPTPVFPLPGSLLPRILAILALPALFHQPVPISAALVFVPFVPVPSIAIVIAVIFGKPNHRNQKRQADQHDCCDSFHGKCSSAMSGARERPIVVR